MGSNHKDQIVFHGGCLGCTRQLTKPLTFCVGCQYFDAEWDLPSLSNGYSSEDATELRRREKLVKRKLAQMLREDKYDR